MEFCCFHLPFWLAWWQRLKRTPHLIREVCFEFISRKAKRGLTSEVFITGFTTGLTNGRAENWVQGVEFSPFRALTRRQMTFPSCCYISLLTARTRWDKERKKKVISFWRFTLVLELCAYSLTFASLKHVSEKRKEKMSVNKIGAGRGAQGPNKPFSTISFFWSSTALGT